MSKPVSWLQVHPVGNQARPPSTCVTAFASGSSCLSSFPHMSLLWAVLIQHTKKVRDGFSSHLTGAPSPRPSVTSHCFCLCLLLLRETHCSDCSPTGCPERSTPTRPPSGTATPAALTQFSTFLSCLFISTFSFGVVQASGSETSVNIRITWKALGHGELDATGLGGAPI